jgi:hypothetical protein
MVSVSKVRELEAKIAALEAERDAQQSAMEFASATAEKQHQSQVQQRQDIAASRKYSPSNSPRGNGRGARL